MANQIVVISSEGRIEISEVEIPVLQAGEILVRNEFVALCRSDINTYIGKRQEKTPTIMGHEIAGRVYRFGPGIKNED